MYSVQDIDKQILNSTYAFPFIGVFADATGSNAAAIGMTVPWAVIGVASCMNGLAAGSRQAWSFARDGGKHKPIFTISAYAADTHSRTAILGLGAESVQYPRHSDSGQCHLGFDDHHNRAGIHPDREHRSLQ
jgi:hypothetical protein